MKNILVVVDMQIDFLTGSLANYKSKEVLEGVIRLINTKTDECVEQGTRLMVYVTKDTHYDNYLKTKEGQKLPITHCVRGTEGWQVHPKVMELLQQLVKEDKIQVVELNKESFGTLDWSWLLKDYVDKGMDITLCGVCTDICVVSNALVLKAMFYANSNISVVREATAGLKEELEEAAIKVMQSCQIDIV